MDHNRKKILNEVRRILRATKTKMDLFGFTKPWTLELTPDRKALMFAILMVAFALCARYATHYLWSPYARLETIVVGAGGMALAVISMSLLPRKAEKVGVALSITYPLCIVAATRSLAALI